MKKVLYLIILTILFGTILQAENKKISVKRGGSKVVKFESVKNIDVSQKSIVNATALSETEIIIEGLKSGSAVVTVNGKYGSENVIVKVRTPSKTERMVEIDVQMLEIINNDDLNFGIDWPTLLSGRNAVLGDKETLASPFHAKESAPPLLAFGTFNRGAINIMLDFLVKENYAKMLAKPKILTVSSRKAKFLSGGEIPIAIVGKDGEIDVEWKEYGVKLEIEPTIVKSNLIRATLKAEVSNLDYANGVQLGVGGGIMPAIKTRWAETTIAVTAEDTIIIAGLIQSEDAIVTSGVPILSDIPLLGELFKHTYKMNKTTELVIFVTPKIVDTGD